MPSFAPIRRPKLVFLSSFAFSPEQRSFAAAAQFRLAFSWSGVSGRSVLRVGDYEVGETFCPRLCGHPDIRF